MPVQGIAFKRLHSLCLYSWMEACYHVRSQITLKLPCYEEAQALMKRGHMKRNRESERRGCWPAFQSSQHQSVNEDNIMNIPVPCLIFYACLPHFSSSFEWSPQHHPSWPSPKWDDPSLCEEECRQQGSHGNSTVLFSFQKMTPPGVCVWLVLHVHILAHSRVT